MLTGSSNTIRNTRTKIRPGFDAIIEKVHASLGQKVKKGDALVDLISTELAAAKNDYKTNYVQWQHDLKLVQMSASLFAKKAISEQPLLDSRNDERKSRLAFTTSKERLLIFGVPEDQIDSLIKDLGNLTKQQQDNNAANSRKLTRLSPVDGIVIERDVVPGNFYGPKDVLLMVAPIDHFLVWTSIPSKDVAHVKVGQACEVLVPFLDQTIATKIDYISREVRDKTETVLRIKLKVPNVEGRLKADMLVRVRLRPDSLTERAPPRVESR